MACHRDGVRQVVSSDIRFIESCLRLMNASGLTVPFTAQSASESTDIINQVIHAWQESTEKKDSFVEWLVDEAKQKLLPLSELDWLKGNDRACYWVWLTLVRGVSMVYQFLDCKNLFDRQCYLILIIQGMPCN